MFGTRLAALLGLLFLFVRSATATPFERRFGGADYDQGCDVCNTADGGFTLVGLYGWNSVSSQGYAVHMDVAGDTVWTKTWGESGFNAIRSLVPLPDGGHLMVGDTNPAYPSGTAMGWLLRTNAQGDTLWTRTFGGPGATYSMRIRESMDGTFLIGGSRVDSLGAFSVSLIEVDINGTVLHDTTYVTPGRQFVWDFVELADRRIVFAGSHRHNSPLSPYLLVLQPDRSVSWSDTSHGSPDDDEFVAITDAGDGTVIVSGYYRHWLGNDDVYLARYDLDLGPQPLWERLIGGTPDETGWGIAADGHGHFLVAGLNNGFGGGDYDAWLLVTDIRGDTLFTRSYGGSGHDELDSIRPTGFNSMIAGGSSSSYSAGSNDTYVVQDTLGVHAHFIADVTEGPVPLTVQFTDLSTDDITAWWWDFDNNGTVDAMIQHPQFVYTDPGPHSVKLTVATGDGRSDSLVRQYYINPPTPPTQSFVDVTAGDLAQDLPANGVAWGDYDGDGDQDVYVSGDFTTPNTLFRNDGADSFVSVTTGPLVGNGTTGNGIAWGDYDNDGDIDIFLGNNASPCQLLRNDGVGEFFEIAGPFSSVSWATGIAWTDYDNDGDLDVYVGNASAGVRSNKLFRNDGGDVFVDVSTAPINDMGYAGAVAWSDFDLDGDQDLYVGNTEGLSNRLYRNDGGGSFVDYPDETLRDGNRSVGAAWCDYDNDGDPDLYVVNESASNRLFRNEGDGSFLDVAGSLACGTGRHEGVAWGDYDNDGDQDLYLSIDLEPNRLFRNDGRDGFVEVSDSPVDDDGAGRGVAWADYDNDGDLDLFLANQDGSNRLYRNDLSPGRNWLQVSLSGLESNASGVGARLRVFAGGIVQTQEISGGSGHFSQNGLVAHFGLGYATVVDSLQIFWPAGYCQTLVGVTPNAHITVTEPIPRADFVGSPTSGHAPLTVQFSDSSFGGPVNWEWDFEDDGIVDSGLQNPTFEYTAPGSYSVLLAVTFPDSRRDTLIRQSYITVLPTYEFSRADSAVFPSESELSHGVAWSDYDMDGDLDVFVCHRELTPNELYRNDGDGTFTPVTSGDIVTDNAMSLACCWGDYDNDGFPDLFVANGDFSNSPEGEDNWLYHNRGDGTFEKVTTSPVVTDGGNSESCGWADCNGDGYLDLFVANAFHQVVLTAPPASNQPTPSEIVNENDFLYLNDGDGGFVKVTTGDVVQDGLIGTDCKWTDVDNDGDMDLLLFNGDEELLIYVNDGSAQFTTTHTWISGLRSGALGDYNADGFVDIFGANAGLHDNYLLANNHLGIPGQFAPVSAPPITSEGGHSWGGSWADYDNDADLDLFVLNTSNGNWLYRNDGAGTFTKMTQSLLATDPGPIQSSATAWADVDQDGDLDVILGNGNWDVMQDRLYVNAGGEHTWLQVRCEGTLSNRSAIGAKVLVQATVEGTPTEQVREVRSLSGGLGQDSPYLHFGLGDASIVDLLRVEWPSGFVDTYTGVEPNQLLVLVEPESLLVDFSAAPRSGHVPLEVQFTDLSRGGATSWEWDLDGDAMVDDTSPNPNHTYDAPGNYTVRLTVSNGEETESLTRVDYILAWGDSADLTNASLPHQASSTYPGYEAAWASDDTIGLAHSWRSGDASTGHDFPHWVAVEFPEPYTVHSLGLLVHADTLGTRLKEFYLEGSRDGVVYEPVHASPLICPDSRSWETYSFEGYLSYNFYRVRGLNNWAVGVGASQMVVEEWELATRLSALFDGEPAEGVHPHSVQFTDRSLGSPLSWQWDFENDGVVDASVPDPIHVYSNPGRHTVRLRVFDGQDSSEVTLPDYIHVLAIPGFAVSDTFGPAPLEVQFTDLTTGDPTGWWWDFENDGTVDATARNPVHVYQDPGLYTVTLKAFASGDTVSVTRPDLLQVLHRNTMIVHSAAIESSDPAGVPLTFLGADSLGAISLFFDFDSSKVAFVGVTSHVPGEFFSSGITPGNKISVQWFDETGGQDPIIPGIDPDTLLSLLFTNKVTLDTTQVTFDESQSVLGNSLGDPIPDVLWLDTMPFGRITINVASLVSGRVGYYWLDGPVPGAVLSMGPPNPDVSSDVNGEYVLGPYYHGDYVLHVGKADDLGGINSLDAIKVVRHSTGTEPFEDPYKERAGEVNRDGLINSLDAIKIVRAAVGLESLPAGAWAFDPDSVIFSPLNGDQADQDFIAIRMGDVNGDWAPEGGSSRLVVLPASSPSLGEAREPTDGIALSLPDTSVVYTSSDIALPITVSGFSNIGAVSLRITFADSVISYMGLFSNVAGITFTSNLVMNEIRIEWFDATGGGNPLSIGDGQLLTLEFQASGEAGESSMLDFTAESVVGDSGGNPIAGVQFIDGGCVLTDQTGLEDPLGSTPRTHLFPVAPAPISHRGTFAFELAESSPVSLRIYDIRGRLVSVLVEGVRSAGRHSVVWWGRDDDDRLRASGVYFVRLTAGAYSETRKFVVVR
jgi:PKD repeat protein